MDAQEWLVPMVLGCTLGMGTHPSKIFNLTQLQTDLLTAYILWTFIRGVFVVVEAQAHLPLLFIGLN